MKLFKIILTTLFAAIFPTAFCQTYISGGIFSNTTWSAEASPYIVTGDIAVYPGITLTVEAGTVVKFNPDLKFFIRGHLLLNGIQNEEIVFTSNAENPAMGDWTGIILENDQGGQIVGTYVHAEFAETFIEIMSYSTGEILNLSFSSINHCSYAIFGYDHPADYTIKLTNDSLTHNNYGVVCGQNLNIQNCVFSDGEKGVHNWEYNLNTTIKNSEFSNFTIWPLNILGIIDSCHIHHNAVGIKMKPVIEVYDCLIEYNNIGILCDYSGVQVPGEVIYNNVICNNTIYNFQHMQNYPINIPNNCWCSDDEVEIGFTIYDAYDDASLGIVTFTPFKTDCIPTFIANDDWDSQYYLYPNPAVDYVQLSHTREISYSIYSINGIEQLRGETEDSIDISSLSKGLYIVRIADFKGDREVCFRKIVKK